MNVTELMIGDLVLVDKEPIKVKQICEDCIICDFGDGDEEVDYFEPIPLTADILKKNDIKCVEIGDNGVCTPPKNRNRYEKWFIHTTFNDTYLWYDRLAKYWHLSNMNAVWINNVHELQNALRMCKIDKEMIL